MWPLNEPQADSGEFDVASGSRTLWSLPAAGQLHWQAQQTGISTTVELSLRLTHVILITVQEKGNCPRVMSQHSMRSPSLPQGPLDRPIGAHLPEGRQGQAGHLQGIDQFWKPLPRLLFSIYNHH